MDCQCQPDIECFPLEDFQMCLHRCSSVPALPSAVASVLSVHKILLKEICCCNPSPKGFSVGSGVCFSEEFPNDVDHAQPSLWAVLD